MSSVISKSKTWLEISRGALEQNLASFVSLVRPVQVMAVVKANAYGHGLKQVVSALEQAAETPAWYGVDQAAEALVLRKMGVTRPILVLGFTPKMTIAKLVRADVSLVAYQPETLRAAARVGTAERPARLHLKLETGLHRQGVDLEALETCLEVFRAYPEKLMLEGVSTHFANVEDTRDDSYAKEQLACFSQRLDFVREQGFAPVFCHTACSAAALLYPDTRFNLIRLGISLYGLWSSSLTREAARERLPGFNLYPTLTWKTMVAQVKDVPAGAPVSYGLTERLVRDSRLAVIPIGYADGFDRVAMSSRGQVLIRGRRCRIVGRVCMNMCLADVTDVPGVQTEDEVVIIGKQGSGLISADEFAELMASINYEAVARINALIPRYCKD